MTDPHSQAPNEQDHAPSEAPMPLGYRDGAQDSLAHGRTRVWQGLIVGFLLPAFWWFGGINQYFHHRQGMGAFGGMALLGVVELIAAVVGLCVRKWRRFAAGLLISIALVLLIFAGTCFVILSSLH